MVQMFRLVTLDHKTLFHIVFWGEGEGEGGGGGRFIYLIYCLYYNWTVWR